MALRDIGRAKLNLTLEVLGRRADGYHELRSLVAFADLGDELTLEPGAALDLETQGPFARSVERRQSRPQGGRSRIGQRARRQARPLSPGEATARCRRPWRRLGRRGCRLAPDRQRQSRGAERSGDGRDCRPPRLRCHGLSCEPARAHDRARRERSSPCAASRLAACCSPIPGVPLPAAAVYAELRADDLRAPLLLGGDGRRTSTAISSSCSPMRCRA